jgi:hypothetical protein
MRLPNWFLTLFTGGVLLVGLSITGVAHASPADPARQAALQCVNFTKKPTESCQVYATAYIAEAHIAQQLYFKYVHSPIGVLKNAARRSYYSTYSATARSTIRSWIDDQPGHPSLAHWPVGSNTVDGPSIDVRTARASLKCHRAVLTTVESLQVRDSNGDPLYNVPGEWRTVVLRHTGGLHFIVESIYNHRASVKLC